MNPATEDQNSGLDVIFEEVYADAPDRELFHYTSLAGLLGIADDRSLWATEIRYLNDEQELVHFRQLMINTLMLSGSADDFEREARRQLISWLEQAYGFGSAVFTTSFTTRGNLLSQWRGYCPHGQGVSIGFPASFVAETARANGFLMGRCIYDADRQRNYASRVGSELLRIARTRGPDLERHPLQSHWGTFQQYEQPVVLISALMKHPAFCEEEEWRFVSAAGRDLRGVPLEFRAGRSSLIPYRKFPLPQIEGGLPISTAYVGPTPSSDLAMGALGLLLQRICTPGMTRSMVACQIPYRP